jgi:IS4 transposase
MVLGELFERFAKESPLPVMVRGALEWALADEALDRLFGETAQEQYVGELAFSTVADLMGMVVAKTRKSMHAAYQAHHESIQVSVKSVYNKLNRLEPAVSAELVRRTAASFDEVIRRMGGELPPLLPGYRVRILDGNHLAATEHRLKELRTTRGGPLPGQALVVLDPQTKLMTAVYPCEDGHAQERSILLDLIEDLRPGDAWIADRNFCTSLFLFELALNQSYFIIREHAANVRYETVGPQRLVGRGDSGQVFEQTIRILNDYGDVIEGRRVTVKLDHATTDGDREIHILTNLPDTIDAVTIATTYRSRWTIEKAFNELTLSLKSEINTLGYPRAALFGFCLGVVIYNVLSVVKGALRAAHGVEKIEQNLSHYYVADEISGVWRGMMIAIPAPHWSEAFRGLNADQLAQLLVRLARAVHLPRYQKHPRGPKKPPLKRTGTSPHVATARILNQRQQRK